MDEPCCAVEAMHAIGGHGHAEKCSGVGGEGSNELLSLSQDFNRREHVQQLSLLGLLTVSEEPSVIVSGSRTTRQTTRCMTVLRAGEVVSVEFPFTDMRGQKRRSGVVLAIDAKPHARTARHPYGEHRTGGRRDASLRQCCGARTPDTRHRAPTTKPPAAVDRMATGPRSCALVSPRRVPGSCAPCQFRTFWFCGSKAAEGGYHSGSSLWWLRRFGPDVSMYREFACIWLQTILERLQKPATTCVTHHASALYLDPRPDPRQALWFASVRVCTVAEYSLVASGWLRSGPRQHGGRTQSSLWRLRRFTIPPRPACRLYRPARRGRWRAVHYPDPLRRDEPAKRLPV